MIKSVSLTDEDAKCHSTRRKQRIETGQGAVGGLPRTKLGRSGAIMMYGAPLMRSGGVVGRVAISQGNVQI